MPGSSGDGGPAIDARFDCPHDLAQDKHGNLYLSDLCNQTYRRIDYETGIVTRVAGSGKTGRGGDGGPALEAEMDTHCGIAIDDDGNLVPVQRVGQQHPQGRRGDRRRSSCSPARTRATIPPRTASAAPTPGPS